MRRALAVAAAAVLAAGCSSGGRPGPVPSGSHGATASISPPSTTPDPTPVSRTELPVPRPPIVEDLIPFPDRRKEETRTYALRHYGLATFELVDPQVIVEHFTAGQSYRPVFDTFAADSPHLGELPGTCSHFVIDTDGTIYQLVPVELMCRHTVGLNWTAVGIEMVGESDQEILGDPAQLDAALDLTLWLMEHLHVQLRNVIGHNESLTSPFHRELVDSLKCQTHQDWNHEDMEVFRADLAERAQAFHLPLGPPATPADSGC